MAEFLDFAEISKSIRFKSVLDWLNVPYKIKKDEIKFYLGEFLIIANAQKNTFFSPHNDSLKGGVINFVSFLKNLSLREAATELKNQFLFIPKAPQREIPILELHYCTTLKNWGIEQTTASMFGIGLVKQKSIMSGRVAFKMLDNEGNLIGYAGFHPEKKDWFFPKGFKRPLYNYFNFDDRKHISLTTDPITCILLCQKGINSVSLLGKSMTDEQFGALKKFEQITIYHPEPENIIYRLSQFTFVKAPEFNLSKKDNSVE